ncbi:type III secretion system inner membrane ring lipoprotein SctJ [Caenimonas sp. SL110]|uniref:type III secretion system inner membrane ring lipoprotein SctJ n=1 Tax=Caenimonas sp. SL110 TaxID=1450524 RepID=UPI00069F9211|nr:type III secretion inner membrane ring lipoprotein SctJ [Caenimonas sp. SL110]
MINSDRPLFSKVARLAAALLVTALVGCGGSVELLSNMNEREANELVAVLSESDIKVQKIPGKDGVVNLMVDKDKVAQAIQILSAEGMPRERRATMGDVFRKEGLISSPLEERARYLWALSQELSETISQVDGVLRARVHVVLPERSTGGEASLPSSAGVFVKHRRTVNLEESVPQIKRLVASSIPGLSVEKVSVVLVASGPAAPPPATAKQVAARSNGSSIWLWVCYLLVALSVLCITAFAVWRMQSKRRADRETAEADGDGERMEPGAA